MLIKTWVKYRSILVIAAVVTCGLFILSACGNETTEDATDTSIITDANAAYLSLAISQTSVMSDNSDTSTVTATLLNTDRVPVEGVSILFTTDGGQISSSNVLTDVDGQASVVFRAGTNDKSNQTVTVQASAVGVTTAQVPIQVTGTKITLESVGNNLEVGGTDEGADTDTLTVTLLDAGQKEIYNAPVTLSASGPITLSTETGITDVKGKLKVTVTGTSAGEGSVTVTSMGATAEQTYTIGSVGQLFQITTPKDQLVAMSTAEQETVTVKAPGIVSVTFGVSMGMITDGSVTAQKLDVPVVNDEASVTFTSSEAGVATVQVYDSNDTAVKDSVSIAVYAPPSEASQISIQASSNVIAPSNGTTENTLTLKATVLNQYDQVVGNAPVKFSIENPTGGGERLSPVIVYTNEIGVATTTFTSGSLSSAADGIVCVAEILKSDTTSSLSASDCVDNSLISCIDIVIGGTAASIAIGTATVMQSVNDDTVYQLPMSVLVTDSNGNPAPQTVVSLSAWPLYYYTGIWVKINDKWTLSYGDLWTRAVISDYNSKASMSCDDESTPDFVETCITRELYQPVLVGFLNEDVNRNLLKDPGEDVDTIYFHSSRPGDGLTPKLSSAGDVPSTVTTDENGLATFNLYYLKTYAGWITTEITASALVYGTETQSRYTFRLGWIKGEEQYLNDSPFNPEDSRVGEDRDPYFGTDLWWLRVAGYDSYISTFYQNPPEGYNF